MARRRERRQTRTEKGPQVPHPHRQDRPPAAPAPVPEGRQQEAGMGKRSSSNRLSRVTEGIKVPRVYHAAAKPPRASNREAAVDLLSGRLAEAMPGLAQAGEEAGAGLSAKLLQGLTREELERYGPVLARIADRFGVTGSLTFGISAEGTARLKAFRSPALPTRPD